MAPFERPLNPLGRSLGQARAKERLDRFWGGSERSSTVNSNTNQPFWAQPRIPWIPQIPRIPRIPRKRCQELRLGTPLPRAPGVRMTGVHKLPQINTLGDGLPSDRVIPSPGEYIYIRVDIFICVLDMCICVFDMCICVFEMLCYFLAVVRPCGASETSGKRDPGLLRHARSAKSVIFVVFES